MIKGENSWVRTGQKRTWKLAHQEEINQLAQKFNPELFQMSSGEKAGVAFGVTGLMVLVVIVVAYQVQKRRVSRFRAS